MSDLETFLAGRAPGYVTIVVADSALDDPEALEAYAEPVEVGQALVLPGADGRHAFRRLTGQDPMAFARAAGDQDGRVDRDFGGGGCPADRSGGDDGEHLPKVILSFTEPEHEAAGGLYAEGPVAHAYVECACGARYSDRWVIERA